MTISAKTDAAMSSLTKAAVTIAMKGAAEWANKNDIIIGDAGLDRLLELLRLEVREALPEAYDDAKAALSAHMVEAAELTFAATMSIAGINAAKQFADTK